MDHRSDNFVFFCFLLQHSTQENQTNKHRSYEAQNRKSKLKAHTVWSVESVQHPHLAWHQQGKTWPRQDTSRLSKMTIVSSFWIISNNASKQWLATRDVRANWLKQSGTEICSPTCAPWTVKLVKLHLTWCLSWILFYLNFSSQLVKCECPGKRGQTRVFTSLFSNCASPASCELGIGNSSQS